MEQLRQAENGTAWVCRTKRAKDRTRDRQTDRQTHRQGSTNRLQSLISANLETDWIYFRRIASDLMFN